MFPRHGWCGGWFVCGFVGALAILLGVLPLAAAPGVVLSEIHYHPVERAAFNSNGTPVLDLTDDLHEFVELHNNSGAAVTLTGWRLAGGINYDFPDGTRITPGQYLVVARNPSRLAVVYALSLPTVLGPYELALGNNGDVVRIENQAGVAVDAVSYSARFPWAISADALGAEDEWTGLRSLDYQYKGRSLERVSFAWPANDAANWLASPLSGPTPGRANTVTRAVPKPVVVEFSATQAADGETPIRAGQSVRIHVRFSATNTLGNISVEYFLDDLNQVNEARQTVTMGAAGPGRYTAVLPARADRTLVRYRIRADRGTGVEAVSPRADDPYGWHAYFVSPLRSSQNPVFDCFIGTARLFTLATNIVDGGAWAERRIVPPNPPGMPRTSWNATEPAVMVHEGVVYDIQMRHHGSQYHRDIARNSFKWQFPRYQRFEGKEGTFITDKGPETIIAHELFRRAGLPSSHTRVLDLYLNSEPGLIRVEEDEMDDVLAERWAEEQAQANPGTEPELVGEFYKSQGVFYTSDGVNQEPLGPFGYGGFRRLPPYSIWSELERYEWTYSLQMHAWKGHTPLAALIQGMWAARGDTPEVVQPNTLALRAFLSANFDVDAVLLYMALRTWMGVWDDYNHNTFAWRRADGRWGLLPWDFDGEFGGISGEMPTSSIYLGEYRVPTGYHRTTWVDANWVKDSFYKSFRNEYKRKLFILNNTLLNPTNISQLGLSAVRGYADARFASINQQLGLGAFHRPQRPVHLSPANNAAALGSNQFVASAYSHSASPAVPHQSTTWYLRTEQGDYAAPLLKHTSTSNLTSLPIPYDLLTFGETYFWKCVYTDTNGHPSLDSAETSFVFGAQPTRVPLIAIDLSTLWRFNRTGTAPANWAQPSFDDSGWTQGAALLADETAALPEPIRTRFDRGSALTFHFRKRFNFTGDAAQARLRLRHIVDDGVVIYLNGVEVWRAGMPSGTVRDDTPAARTVADAVYEGPFSIPSHSLVNGENVIAAEVHQSVSTSTDVVFGLSLEAYVPPAVGSLVLNEILADNHGSALHANLAPDFIELRNTGDVPYNLNGISVSDNVERPGKYVFPPNTSIPAGGYLVLWCDDATNAPGLHTGFALDNDGQTVALFVATAGGYALADAITFGLQVPDLAVGRDSSGAWGLLTPTPGAANVSAPVGSPTALRVNEWLASDPDGPDWFELYNTSASPVPLGGLYLTDRFSNPTNTRVTPLSFIAPFGYRQFIADNEPEVSARHVDFQLSASGEAIALYDAALNEIDSVLFGPQTPGIAEGRLPDGAASFAFFPGSSSPGAANYQLLQSIVINEVLPHLELRNTGGTAIDVSGWWLSDNAAQLQQFEIPAGSVIEPGGFWWADIDAMPLRLDLAQGGRVYLSRPDGQRTSARYGIHDGFPYGTILTSLGEDFVQVAAESFGGPNPPARVGPIILNEIQYHPPDLPADDDDYEFVELINISGGPVTLFDPAHAGNRWRLRDAVSYTFPPGITLGAGETALVLGFDPTNVVKLANFQAVYAVPGTVRLFGPYEGKLENSGASVELVKPGPPVTTPGPGYDSVGEILIDRVNYGDSSPWPAAADGSGASLQRLVARAYGNDPTNWIAAAVSPGRPHTANLPPTAALSSPSHGASFNSFFPLTLTVNAQDPDGTVLRVEFFVDGTKLGEDWTPPFSLVWSNAPLGSHVLQVRATDRRLATSLSAAVTVSATNAAPSVALLAPAPDALFTLPTNILIEASASDVDGGVTRVEFLANGQKIGESPGRPGTGPSTYSLVWSNLTRGTFALTARVTDSFGLVTTSAPRSVRVQQFNFVAYVVPGGTIGAVSYDSGFGFDFQVNSPILVTALGVFDSGGDGIHASSTMTSQIYRRSGNTGTLLSSLAFQSTNYGKLNGGSRFKVLPQPLVLSNGSYSVVCYGFSVANAIGDQDYQAKTWSTDTGAGLISFVGATRFGPPTPGVFPAGDVGGDADHFAAGTFEFRRLPTQPVIVDGPTSVVARAGTTVNLQVVTYSPTAVAYQWYFQGAPLAGRTSAILSLANFQAGNVGSYFVTISNALGRATSDVATASLVQPPTIVRQPQPVTVLEGATARFNVEVGGTPPFVYRWRTNGTIIVFPGSPELIMNAVPASLHGSRIDVIASSSLLGLSATSSNALLQVFADFDKDGMADLWEVSFNLNTNSVADAHLDPDGDGQSNRNEYVAGTNPQDPESFLRVERITRAGPAVALEFLAVSNRTYRVFYKESLETLLWEPLGDVPAQTTNRLERLLDPEPSAPTRFYRLATPAER